MTDVPVVIGVGSDNGDDAAGWIAVEQLRELGWPSDSALIARHPAELLDWCNERRALIICDACAGSGDAGTRSHFTWPTDELPASPPRGSHEMSLSFVLELGRTLGRIPAAVDVWTVEGRSWLPSRPASPLVEAAAKFVGGEIHATVFGASQPAQH